MALQPDIQYVSFYMDGSTAKKMERQAVGSARAPRPRYHKTKRRVVRVDPVAIAGIAVAMVMLVAMLAGVVQYGNCLQRSQQMDQYIQQLQLQNGQLQQTYRDGYDLDEIRDIADALGMVPADTVEEIPIQVQVPQPEEPRELSFWENAAKFLAGLFA